MQMAMETPQMDPGDPKTKVLRWIDVSTTIVFWAEVVLKIVAFSFKAYISYFTNKVRLGRQGSWSWPWGGMGTVLRRSIWQRAFICWILH
jgi:hypothetical protein